MDKYFYTALKSFIKHYEFAKCKKHIRKPVSWALYEVWKTMDAIEEERNNG